MGDSELEPEQVDQDRADPNRDPGADIESEGVPKVADDSTPGTGETSEPERPAAPTDVPTATTAYGTTDWEQRHPEPLSDRLAEEENENEVAEHETVQRQPEEAAIRVDDEPNSPAGEGP